MKNSSQRRSADILLRSRKRGGTLVVIAEVDDYFIEVLQTESIKNLGLSLGLICDVTVYCCCYLTNFFMDSMSIFFYSRGLIMNLTYIIIKIDNCKRMMKQGTMPKGKKSGF